MNAAFIEEQGGPEVLKYGEVADPVAGSNEVVVDIHAASVNGADWNVRSGKSGAIAEFPYILGRDFSGVVAALGEGVEDLVVGDAVFGVCDAGQEGAYAEKIAIKAAIIARKPALIPHGDMAALSLTGLTALVAVEDMLHLQSDERILIQGGAGGVVGFAIQLAKHLGAYVITTARAVNHEYLRDLGADEIIDYQSQDFTKLVSDCDAVFDTVGGEVAQRSFAVLKPGGRAAFIASGATAPEPPRADLGSLRPKVARDRGHLERIAALAEAGAIRASEITVFPLTDAAAAHTISESRHLRGNLIFAVR